MVLKTTGTISRFKCKNLVEKHCNKTWDVFITVFWLCEPSQEQILINIFGNIGSFYKLIFALKPWDRASCLEYQERGENDKIKPFTSEMVQIKWFCRKIWADGAKQVLIWVSVSTKDESVEISQSPANFFHFVMQCNLRGQRNKELSLWCFPPPLYENFAGKRNK